MTTHTPVARAIACFIIAFVGGNLFGFNIGYVGPMLTTYKYVSNCTATMDPEQCKWISDGAGVGSCVWGATITLPNKTKMTVEGCFFADLKNCSSHNDQSGCAGDDSCVWDDTDKVCNHNWGFTASQNGLIATMMILGAMFMSFNAGKVVDRFGLKMSLGIASGINLLASVLQFVSWSLDAFGGRFGLMLVARFICGLSLGISTVAAPMYNGDVATKEHANVLGVCFQIFVTFGIVFAAFLGYVLHPPETGSTKADTDRFQVLNAVNLVLTVLQGLAAWWCMSPEEIRSQEASAISVVSGSSVTAETPSEEERMISGGNSGKPKNPAASGEDEVTLFKSRWVFVAMLLGAILQLSGINGIMNFAPQIAADSGLKNPFLANFIVMIVNFVTTLISIPVAKKLEPRNAFFVGGILCGAMCLVTAIPTFPGVAEASVRDPLLATGILGFIALFEILVGPPFYGLAQSLAPTHLRASHTSMALGSNFVFNAIMNFLFPVAVQALSGGASGNQRKGLAIMFIVFGVLSIVLTFVLMAVLRGAKTVSDADADTGVSDALKRASAMSDKSDSGIYGAMSAGSSSPKM